MIFLPWLLIWPLALLCDGEPWWFSAQVVIFYLVGDFFWVRWCMRRSRSAV